MLGPGRDNGMSLSHFVWDNMGHALICYISIADVAQLLNRLEIGKDI